MTPFDISCVSLLLSHPGLFDTSFTESRTQVAGTVAATQERIYADMAQYGMMSPSELFRYARRSAHQHVELSSGSFNLFQEPPGYALTQGKGSRCLAVTLAADEPENTPRVRIYGAS